MGLDQLITPFFSLLEQVPQELKELATHAETIRAEAVDKAKKSFAETGRDLLTFYSS